MSSNDTLTVPNVLTMPMFPNMLDMFQLQLEAFAENKRTSEKQSPAAEKRTPIPYSVLVGLALINANGEPISTVAIYDFIEEYFPNSPNISAQSWKSSIRNALCKYDFVGKTPYLGRRAKDHYDWIIVKENIKRFDRLLNRFERKHPDISNYGLRDIADWPLMKTGKKGIPEWKGKSNVKAAPNCSKEPSPPSCVSPRQSSSCPPPQNPFPSPPVPPFSLENMASSPLPQPSSTPSFPMCAWNPMTTPFMLPCQIPPPYLYAYLAGLKQHINKLEEMQTTELKS